jgi:CheY-like chemotaxis protein
MESEIIYSNEKIIPSKSRKKKILLVDDDNAIRRYIEVVLKKANFDVVSAEDGLSAMKIGLSQEIDAVVADSIMPNMGGHDLCRMLRNNPKNSDVFFVLMSGVENNRPQDSQTHLVDVYLTKGAALKDEIVETLSKLFANPFSKSK